MRGIPFFLRRRFLIAIFAAIVVLSLAVWGLWFLSALEYRRVIDGWIEQGRAAGYQISYDDRQLFGFPRRLTMRLIGLRWQSADGIAFHTDDMDISAMPWDWNNFDAKFKNHVTLAAPLDGDGKALMLSGASGRAHVRLDAEGIWRAVTASLNHVQVGLAPDYLFQAARLEAAVARPDKRPLNHTEVGLTVEGEADDILLPAVMPSPFGNKAARFSMHMRVMGAVPDVRNRASVDAWNKDSGIVEFDDFSLDWGVLGLVSKGTLGFDDDLQPEGAFAGTIANPDKTLQALREQGFVVLHDEDMLAAALNLFSSASSSDAKGLAMPITIQLGGLFLGPIRVFNFPAIEWPTKLN